MTWSLRGWLPTLIFVPISGAAFGFGLWKSGGLYSLSAILVLPMDWKNRTLALPGRISGEKLLFCFMLSLVSSMSWGVEAAGQGDETQSAGKHRSPLLSALIAKTPLFGAADGTGQSLSPREIEKRRRSRLAHRYRAAVSEATACNNADARAAGILSAVISGRGDHDLRAATSIAADACGQTWGTFNGLYLDGMRQSSAVRVNEEQLRACDEGYLGRWQINDDLGYVIDEGLTAKSVSRLEERSVEVRQRLAECAPLLRQLARAD